MFLIQTFFIVTILIQNSNSFWWSLGSPTFQPRIFPTDQQKQFCSSLTFLTAEQRFYCQKNPKTFTIIHRSLHQAINECQYQFRNQRWNCSLYTSTNTHGKFLIRKTPETAFIYALTSAAVMHNIAKACSRGELNECSCDKTQIKTKVLVNSSTSDGFEWGGCSDNLKFGRNVSMSFLDQQEMFTTRRRIVRMVNLHNNEAGRQAVERNVQLTCKCHGVSGSCSLRVCWRTLPNFRLIGSELRTKYESTVQVQYNRRLSILKPRKNIQKLFNTTDLIHIHTAPSYCEKNLRLGSLGTQGRECNLTMNEPGSCSLLCCDRGYETIVTTIEEDCDCQFHWCCEVRCKRCIKKIEKHYCK